MNSQSEIVRHGVTQRWSDAVIHQGTIYFVEVPDDPLLAASEQFTQVLSQVETRLASFGSSKSRLLQVLIYLPDPEDLAEFNRQWDAWVPEGHAPSRACVHAPLAAAGYRVELVLTAAT